MTSKRSTFILITILLVFLIIYANKKYKAYFSSNVPAKLENDYLYIPTGSTFDELVTALKEGGFVKNEESFRKAANLKSFGSTNLQAGRYKVEESWSNNDLINHLRSGKQATVKLTLTTARLLEDIAGRAAKYIESDSLQILEQLRNKKFLSKHGLNLDDAMTVFIPNTYDFFWNTSPKVFFERMQKENKRFWVAKQREEKAKSKKLTKKEVYILASIVEKETISNKEKPRVAGLYLNRLRKNMLLQADPTAVFATRDFGTRRVLNKHIEYDSPYNTYIYAGLPPGPICMPSIASIDAVLNAESHDYIYMCAKADNSGLHAFAKTLAGHNANAAKYRRWLNTRGIR